MRYLHRLAIVAVAVTSGVLAAVPAHANPTDVEADAEAVVVAVDVDAEGDVVETTYTPAPEVTLRDLMRRLTAQGVRNVVIRRPAGISAQVAACSLGPARTWPSAQTCFVKWSKNGAARPVIDFVDSSGSAWPIGRAITEWNKTSGIDSIYRPTGAGCDGAPAHCVKVTSNNYGATGWVGETSRTLNAAGTYYNSASVRLNDHYGGSEAERWNSACHELGHVLGLGHSTSTASCMYYQRTAHKYPHADDRKLLERYY